MCEYCSPGPGPSIKAKSMKSDDIYLKLTLSDKFPLIYPEMVNSKTGKSVVFQIIEANYCLICGRKLEREATSK